MDDIFNEVQRLEFSVMSYSYISTIKRKNVDNFKILNFL